MLQKIYSGVNILIFIMAMLFLLLLSHASHAQNGADYELKVNMEHVEEIKPGWTYYVGSDSTPNQSLQIDCGTNWNYSQRCSQKFQTGSKVILRLAISDLYYYNGWEGCDQIQEREKSSLYVSRWDCHVTMNSNRTVQVRMMMPHKLQVKVIEGKGAVAARIPYHGYLTVLNCSDTNNNACEEKYHHNAAVRLTATPKEKYSFAGWGGACMGIIEPVCTVKMDDAKYVTASFADSTVSTNRFNLNVSTTGNGTVTSAEGGIQCGNTCSAHYSAGTTVGLIAVAASGYSFSHWGGACLGSGACNARMNSNQSVTATFHAAGGGEGNSGSCQARTFSTNEERILDVFIAYYGRIADLGGFSYWAAELGKNSSNVDAMMHNFGNDKEYWNRFGSMNNTQLVNNLFQQMFGREADPTGLNFYTHWLTTGEKSLTNIALTVLDGARVNPGNADALSVENRKKVARHYITKVEPLGSDIGLMEPANLSSLIAAIDASEASADAACIQLDSLLP